MNEQGEWFAEFTLLLWLNQSTMDLFIFAKRKAIPNSQALALEKTAFGETST